MNGLGSIGSVAYDEDLAERMRELLAEQADVTEQKMFGGLAFLIGGHMAVVASGKGGIMVRCDPASSDRLVASTPAELAVMGGRELDGWLRVGPDHLRTKRQLGRWVALGRAWAGSLPPKAPKAKKTRRPPVA